MKKILSVVLVGPGGFGSNYLHAMMRSGEEKSVRWAGIVEPFPLSCPELPVLVAQGIKHYLTLEEFYRECNADLCIISSPIHFHCEQTLLALSKGSHVMCEKPIAATLREASAMSDAQKASGLLVGIGYQWSFSPVITALKADILAGNLGAPKRLKTIVLWPRSKRYYTRGGGWAGKQRDAEGRYVLDSVASNATAHYLHNMLYLLGDAPDTTVVPDSITAMLMRANPIEMYDTASLSIRARGADLLFHVSHAVAQTKNPTFDYSFEEGRVNYPDTAQEGNIVLTRNDGTTKEYGNPFAGDETCEKLWMMVAAIRGEGTLPCTIESAIPHVTCTNGALFSMTIKPFPKDVIRVSTLADQQLTHVEGLEQILLDCYAQNRMPTLADAPWVTIGRTVDLAGMKDYHDE